MNPNQSNEVFQRTEIVPSVLIWPSSAQKTFKRVEFWGFGRNIHYSEDCLVFVYSVIIFILKISGMFENLKPENSNLDLLPIELFFWSPTLK